MTTKTTATSTTPRTKGIRTVVVPRTKRASGTTTTRTTRKTKHKRKKGDQGEAPFPLEGSVGKALGRGSPSPLGAAWVLPQSSEADDVTAAHLNLAVFSDVSERLVVSLFTAESLSSGSGPVWEYELDPAANRTGDVWHCSLEVETAQDKHKDLFYAYRVAEVVGGPAPGPGIVFEEDGLDYLIDPYAVAVASRATWGRLASSEGAAAGSITDRFGPCWAQHACCFPDLDDFDWEGDKPLNLRMEDLVIYELHVRGFTAHASSGVCHPGTYKGLAEKLDYLSDLGVNCVELMPINEFNELEYYELKPSNGVYRYNVWGYSTVSFFAPMARYASCLAESEGDLGRTGEVVREFKEMVKACHARGIEVILDVVFNHTAEGNHQGPCLSFRGLGNRAYYMLAPQGEYYNYSGCGNTMNCNHPVTREFILDCLRYWVVEMHVDGFRFDLASILSRNHSSWVQGTQGSAPASPQPSVAAKGGPTFTPTATATARGSAPPAGALGEPPEADLGVDLASGEEEWDEYVHDADQPTGKPLSDPPLLHAISTDPVLRDTKLIAEAWDCDGLNQVGSFPHYGGRWSEWNGIFRDNVRNFIKGSDGPWAGTFAGAICGSPDVYGNPEPGEGDWWGSNDGRRWRGARGPTASVNFVTAHDGFTLADLVSYNSKHNEANGERNNDGEQHNNSWNCGHEGKTEDQGVIRLRHKQLRNFATALLVSQGVPMLVMGDEYGHSKGGNNNTYCHDGDINYFQWDVCEKQKGLVRFFKKLIHLRKSNPNLRQSAYMDGSKIQWHGLKAGEPDWSDTSRLVAFSVSGDTSEWNDLYVAFNSGHEKSVAELPVLESGHWDLIVDTSKPSPFDYLESDDMLGADDLRVAKGQCEVFLDEEFYPIAPYSSVILRRVKQREGEAGAPLEDFSIGSVGISKEAQSAGARTKKRPKAKKKASASASAATAAEEEESLLQVLEENKRLKALLDKKRQKK